MSYETKFWYGRQIVSGGHIFPAAEILPCTKWMSSCGHIVTVSRVEGPEIYYKHADGNEQSKDYFSFQSRYSLVVD